MKSKVYLEILTKPYFLHTVGRKDFNAYIFQLGSEAKIYKTHGNLATVMLVAEDKVTARLLSFQI